MRHHSQDRAMIVKVDCIPSVAGPVEGVNYRVLDGEPSPGDFIRISGKGEMFTVQSAPPEPYVPSPKALTKDEFAALLTENGSNLTQALANWPVQ